MRNNLAVSLLALKNKKNLNKFFSILKCENIRYVELPILKLFKNYSPSKKKLNVLKKKLKKNSLKITSIQALFYGRENLSIFRINDTKDIINHLKKVIKIAKYFGASNLIFGSPNNRNLDNSNKADQLKNGLKLFKKIGQLCKKNKIYFIIEPNAKIYNCNYINSIKQALNLIKIINSQNILINVDTGNISLEREKLINYKKKNKYFKNFQISEKNLADIRRSKFDHVKILKKFNISNKIISLEMKDQKISNLKSQIKKFKAIVNNV